MQLFGGRRANLHDYDVKLANKSGNGCYYRHGGSVYRVQVLSEPVLESVNADEITSAMWRRRGEGLVHAVVFTVALYI
uniref:Polyprotein n=1 Tax=Panagrellus redivivus TaxID=6233 RepID=A0A7E4VZC3_PANRE